ncbi:MAG: chemotaxis protein [Deltaproteobacteria bacterium]|nr:chemotaxis protein [Deltaproteobacteria bacterium]
MFTRRYALYGALFGLSFPVVASLVQAAVVARRIGIPFGAGLAQAQGEPLIWIIWTAPLFLGLVAALAGRRQDQYAASERVRREAYLRTAQELTGTAQALLSTVSSFSSMASETAASVRETTATMGQLGQTATQAALTAETVIGVALGARRTADEGVGAVEAAAAETAKLIEEVRGLSTSIEQLNGRMRDIFEIASVVNYIADRSQRLAEAAAVEVQSSRAEAQGLAGVVDEMRHHAEDAKRAAQQVKAILGTVHKAMLGAMTAAEIGIRRAEQSSQVTAGTGDAIRRLATALRESSDGAREIATVAQQQDHGIDQVLKAMNEIYLATQETMTSTQQVALQARSLNDLAIGLKKGVEG